MCDTFSRLKWCQRVTANQLSGSVTYSDSGNWIMSHRGTLFPANIVPSSVSRHHGGLVVVPPETPMAITTLWNEGFKGVSWIGPSLCRETPVSRTAKVNFFPSGAMPDIFPCPITVDLCLVYNRPIYTAIHIYIYIIYIYTDIYCQGIYFITTYLYKYIIYSWFFRHWTRLQKDFSFLIKVVYLFRYMITIDNHMYSTIHMYTTDFSSFDIMLLHLKLQSSQPN